MKEQQKQQIFQRSTSACTATTRNSRRILPSNLTHFRSFESDDVSDKLLVRRGSSPSVSNLYQQQQQQHHAPKLTQQNKISSLIRSFLNIFTFPTMIPTCKWLTIPSQLSVTPSLGRKVTGTLFGHRRGHISFAVQLHPRAEPVLLLELAMSTSSLVKEMSSSLVRIALECQKVSVTAAVAHNNSGGGRRRLFQEPAWTMYCNGRNCGYAVSRTCGDLDLHVLSTVQSVSVGAGVIPLLEDGKGGGSGNGGSEGELMYMRARFERVVGSRDSEAFYMLNPDGEAVNYFLTGVEVIFTCYSRGKMGCWRQREREEMGNKVHRKSSSHGGGGDVVVVVVGVIDDRRASELRTEEESSL
ncbi:Protein MIZU-KUSSEI 1 [Glycine max]|uniref:Protein MIZU-KUSSEI 1 n=1 Tax=Glycine soja TaxID=3848 RepID=A0A445LQN4_GLYSO|nr:Protein MIZU-KUSSEI 1 [Glycine max]RZC25628.1 Protein MIZU-KUSSEI 1 [Glycine soja]